MFFKIISNRFALIEFLSSMKKISLYILLVFIALSCGSSEQGELVGVGVSKKWHSERPLGMSLIPGGSFTMGKQSEDVAGALNAPSRTVTVRPVFMDDTEITNSEYKEFVYWVRDSIIRTELALYAELLGEEGLENYKFQNIDESDLNPYQQYMMEAYGSIGGDPGSPTEGKMLNWDEEIIWNTGDFPSVQYAEVMVDSVFVPIEDSFEGRRIIDVNKLKFKYVYLDQEAAARNKGSRRNYIKEDIIQVYPDTTVWVRDFNYSYNDPMHQNYFYHQAYNDYPVVGVSWLQAKAFCRWRTKKKNDYLSSRKNAIKVPQFRLATETEWEFAARGGLENPTYPWGNPYPTTDRGCFLANFKPSRGNYAVDGALYTVEAKSYPPNDYGLYNMSGNVAEWTNTAYEEASYYIGSTINPNVKSEKNQRRVIRGGSWKDVAYFLEVSTRDYEYSDSARSYIGFRTVQDYLGTNMDINE